MFEMKAEIKKEDEIKISKEIAQKILEMEEICFSEGIGPDISKVLLWISEHYPDLKEKFNYLNWPNRK